MFLMFDQSKTYKVVRKDYLKGLPVIKTLPKDKLPHQTFQTLPSVQESLSQNSQPLRRNIHYSLVLHTLKRKLANSYG